MFELIAHPGELRDGDIVLACRVRADARLFPASGPSEWADWNREVVGSGGWLNVDRLASSYKTCEFKILRDHAGEPLMVYRKGQGWVYVF